MMTEKEENRKGAMVMKTCPKCGKRLDAHVKFCSGCGCAVGEISTRLRIHVVPREERVTTRRVEGAFEEIKVVKPELPKEVRPVPKMEKPPVTKKTLAAQATSNEKPTMASMAVIFSRKREKFLEADKQGRRDMMDTALNELLDGRLLLVKKKLKRLSRGRNTSPVVA